MKKRIAFIIAAVLCAAAFAGCSSGSAPAAQSTSEAASAAQSAPETPSEAASPAEEAPSEASEELEADPSAQESVLIVGLDDTFAPMGFRDEAGQLVGFDIDLATAVAKEMGVEIKFQPISWDAKEMELESRNIDCIWNGMSRTAEREEMWTLSQNYLNNKIIIMTAPDVEITDKAQLADYQIGTQAKSAALEVIQADEIYDSIAGSLQEYPTYDEVILDMQAGRIQIMIVDDLLGQYKNNNLEQKLNISAVDFGEDLYCIGFRKADTDLCARVEEALKAVQASGEASEISNKWFGEDLMLAIQ